MKSKFLNKHAIPIATYNQQMHLFSKLIVGYSKCCLIRYQSKSWKYYLKSILPIYRTELKDHINTVTQLIMGAFVRELAMPINEVSTFSDKDMQIIIKNACAIKYPLYLKLEHIDLELALWDTITFNEKTQLNLNTILHKTQEGWIIQKIWALRNNVWNSSKAKQKAKRKLGAAEHSITHSREG